MRDRRQHAVERLPRRRDDARVVGRIGLIPIYGVAGELVSYQHRPDSPRIVNGRPLKCETPKGSRMVLDVPRPARPWLGHPARPLFITEGARKADSAVSRGLCCLALLGVWNWRGTNGDGGATALADWESIALNGRLVYLDAAGWPWSARLSFWLDALIVIEEGGR